MTPRWVLHIAGLVVPKVRSNLAVDAGDVRRDRREWSKAAHCYARALRICPDRWPIWVQLGHVRKENGELEAALAAYRRACTLPGDDDDAHWHRGLVARRLGALVEAKAALREATRRKPDNADLRAEFLELLHDSLAVDDRAKEVANALHAAEDARVAAVASTLRVPVVFDASDLVNYFRHSRLPTGIQRVQMEVILAAFDMHVDAQVGCFSDWAGTWSRIPAAHFQTLCTLAVSSGDRMDPAWIDALDILTATLAVNSPVTFSPGTFLVNLGSSWCMPNYFLHLRQAQQRSGIHYVPFVHDFIPAIAPEHFVEQLSQDFLGWAFQVFRHADFFLVNSRSTRDDLHRVANILGYDVPPAHVACVPLDADFRRPGLAEAALSRLAQWGLRDGRYVLFVSTVESRKNHPIAFQAWRDLIDRHGADRVPDLVCVGHRGWLNDHVYAVLDEDPVLAAKVHMLSQLSDEQVSLLYRRCLFTLYPSLYEGWGLPITESLSYAKVPVLCRQSSMPEAGGRFALYFEPGDLAGLVTAAETLIFDPSARSALEQDIREGFLARTWREVAQQILDDIDRFSISGDGGPKVLANPVIGLDRLYHLTRNQRRVLTPYIDEGEQLRTGNGWWQPEDWGCPTRPEGGGIAFAVRDGTPQMRVWVRLHNPPGRRSDVTIQCGTRELRCDLPSGPACWVSFVADVRDGNVAFVIRGHACVDRATETGWRDRRKIGVGISGLIVTANEQVRTLLALTRTIAENAQSTVRLVRDAHLLLVNRTVDALDLQDWLSLLEAGVTSKWQMIETLARSPDQAGTSLRAIVFD
jgi:glycosyltransferase involved in cell wall biosynthesis